MPPAAPVAAAVGSRCSRSRRSRRGHLFVQPLVFFVVLRRRILDNRSDGVVDVVLRLFRRGRLLHLRLDLLLLLISVLNLLLILVVVLLFATIVVLCGP